MPDIADETIVLESTGSRILGDDEKYLAKMNRAGLPVLKRIETWALTAVDGKPFQKALDWVKDKQDGQTISDGAMAGWCRESPWI